MTQHTSRKLEHPPLEGEGRRERSERRGGVTFSRKTHPTPAHIAHAMFADPPPPGEGGTGARGEEKGKLPFKSTFSVYCRKTVMRTTR
ncbi:MAG: hypothetical protein QOH67_1612 [Hyphomicrobiales bacterium]|nr:hypothetical protein [Hyphomicrobiales bacterium]